jgi:hypothetical protein
MPNMAASYAAETIVPDGKLNIRATSIVYSDLQSNHIGGIETDEEIKTYTRAEQDNIGPVFCPNGRRDGKQYSVYFNPFICSRTSQGIYSFFSASADRYPYFCVWLCQFLFPAPDGRAER